MGEGGRGKGIFEHAFTRFSPLAPRSLILSFARQIDFFGQKAIRPTARRAGEVSKSRDFLT